MNQEKEKEENIYQQSTSQNKSVKQRTLVLIKQRIHFYLYILQLQ